MSEMPNTEEPVAKPASETTVPVKNSSELTVGVLREAIRVFVDGLPQGFGSYGHRTNTLLKRLGESSSAENLNEVSLELQALQREFRGVFHYTCSTSSELQQTLKEGDKVRHKFTKEIGIYRGPSMGASGKRYKIRAKIEYPGRTGRGRVISVLFTQLERVEGELVKQEDQSH